jgi:acyl-CoA dehydrogenase
MPLGFELSPEQRQLKETAHRFAVDEIIPKAAQYDEDHTFPADVVRKAWEVGLMNLQIPHEYGGLALGVLDTCLVDEELNYGCAGISNAIGANNLAICPLVIAGSDEQKKRYLGWLTSEPAFAPLPLPSLAPARMSPRCPPATERSATNM